MSLGNPEVLSSTKKCMEHRIMELEVDNSRLRRLVDRAPVVTEGLRSFLRQIVPNATADEAVSIFAGEFRRGARMWRTVCITFKGDRRHSDDRSLSLTPRRGISGMPLFEVVRMAGFVANCNSRTYRVSLIMTTLYLVRSVASADSTVHQRTQLTLGST